jgi:Spy/CpxP family protein refolding chaperone
MKTLTVALLLSVALIGSFASHAQSTPKKDAKTEEAKTPKTTTTKTTSITSSTSITVSKGSGSAAFGSHLEPILAFVNATDEQRKSITEIVEEHKLRITALRKRHDELRDAFLKALTSGQAGEAVLATQSDFIRAQNDLNAQYLAVRLKTQQVLTPEQNEKYKEYRLKQGWNSK